MLLRRGSGFRLGVAVPRYELQFAVIFAKPYAHSHAKRVNPHIHVLGGPIISAPEGAFYVLTCLAEKN